MIKMILKYWLGLAVLLFIFSCSEKNDPAPPPDDGNLVNASPTGSWAAVQLKLLIQLAGRDIDPNLFLNDVDVYKVVYKTTYKEEEIDASGLIILPKTTSAVPMISFQRGTIVEQSAAPSVQGLQSESVVSYSALASMGFITVVPDLIGFGESKDIFHPYYIEEPTATAVIDLLKAATILAQQKEVDFDGRLFLAGYSQGGYATLAAHKAIEANPLEGFELIASFPGAGGYDINAMLDHFITIDTYNDPYYLAFVGMSYESYYGQDAILDQFFNEPYAARIPSLFNGINSSAQIDDQLTSDISALIREEVRANSDAYPLNAFLRQKFDENSLVDWTPVAPVFLYHGDADGTVPVENSEISYNKLLDRGANPDNLELNILPGRDHGTAIEPYIEDVVKKLQELK